jgi:hypothetical protein
MTNSSASIWETPFTYAQYPSVGLVIEPDGEGTALLVVAPGGLDAHPKYIVRFTHVFAVTCGEEAGFMLELGQEHSPRDVIAHVWDESPYSAAYANTAFGADLEIRHYVVFGGDNIASIVCGGAPAIETITAPTELAVRYAV